MKKSQFIITVTLILILTSCSEEWLKPKPLSFFTPEDTFIDADGMRGALVACLRNQRDEYYRDNAPIITEFLFTEMGVEGTTDKSGPAMNMDMQILPDACLNHTDCNRIGWYWYEGFKGIKYANVVITRIDEAEYESDDVSNAVLGAAYFHRASRYYKLTHQFGDVPLILDEITEPKLDFYSTSRETILRKIKEDLEFAAEWVPESMPQGDINNGAVNHLLTKVNLSLGEFDDAIASATAVIDGGMHSLMEERFGKDAGDPSKNIIWDLHQVENKALPANKEAIYIVLSREDFVEGSDRMRVMRNTVPFWGNNIKTPSGKPGTSDKTDIKTDQATAYGRGIGRLRPTSYAQFTIWDDDNDLRHAPGNWMTMEELVYNDPGLEGDPYYNQPLRLYDDNEGILCSDTIRSWFEWPHYKLYIADPTNSVQPQGGRGDWYIFRLAETYLLRAEAYFWKGETALAADDLNRVRERAGCSPYSSGQINIGTILDERARELYYEEPRNVELTRISYIFAKMGKAAYNGKSYTVSNFSENNFWYDRVMEHNNFYRENVPSVHHGSYRISPYHVLWPVPANAINSNTRGVINQNRGYPGAENNVPPLTEIVVNDS